MISRVVCSACLTFLMALTASADVVQFAVARKTPVLDGAAWTSEMNCATLRAKSGKRRME